MSTVVVTTTNYSVPPALGFLYLAFVVIGIVAGWKVFEKAGEKGWKVLIPFYNLYTLFRIAGRNGWWMLALFVPFVNIVVGIMLALDLAKHFGKGAMFAIFGLILFPYIGSLMLAFGEAQYTGAKHV
jgi:hypothetical protein